MAIPAALDDNGLIVTCPKCDQKNRLAWERLGENVQCGKCKNQLTAPAAPIELASSADFDLLITKSSIPVVVDYWAPWCGPCRMVAPELQKVAATGDAAAIKTQFGKTGESCKACHDKFRKDE